MNWSSPFFWFPLLVFLKHKHPPSSRGCDLHAGASMSKTYRRRKPAFFKEIIKHHLSEQLRNLIYLIQKLENWFQDFSGIVFIPLWGQCASVCWLEDGKWCNWFVNTFGFGDQNRTWSSSKQVLSIHENNGKTVSSWVSLQSCMK